MRTFTHTVTPDEANEKLSVKEITDRHFSFSSRLRSKIKKENLITVNSVVLPVWTAPHAGDVICVTLPDEYSNFEPQDVPIEIIYEDEDIMALNKAPGFIVHPSGPFTDHTIANGLARYMNDSGDHFKIRFINRLDMDTSGVLLVAKNSFAQDAFVKAQRDGLVQKKYLALVEGVPEESSATIDAPIDRPDPTKPHRGVVMGGKKSKTSYRVINSYVMDDGFRCSLIELILHSGRTHQIRVHMQHIGHTLLGDDLYGGDMRIIKRQALHAESLIFPNFSGNEPVTVTAPLADDISDVISHLIPLS